MDIEGPEAIFIQADAYKVKLNHETKIMNSRKKGMLNSRKKITLRL